MLLNEIFSDDDGSMIDHLRSQVMDYLTPLAAKGVDFIPIQEIRDVLRQARSGLIVDRGLIMRIIEPNICKLVNRVEGDKVYLSLPVDEISARNEHDKEKEAQKIQNKAMDVAKKALGEE